MIRAYGRALAQLLDPRILRVMVLSVVVTVVVYIALLGGLVWGLAHVELAHIPWLDSLARFGTFFSALLLATLLFPGAVTAVIAFRQDAIADAVEARYYPGLPPARDVPVLEAVGAGARLLALTVILNLAMLPLYLALIFLPPMNAVAFIVVNGLILGRAYFNAVALRRLTPAEGLSYRYRGRRQIWVAGTVAALILTVPGINLFAPVLATAAFVHIFHGLRADARAS